MSKIILSVSNLTKEFEIAPKYFWERIYRPKKKFTVVDNISFNIKEGEILGLLGPNGAGKTTTTQMLLGITTPTKGEITVFGMDFKKNRTKILQNLNFSSAYLNLPWRLTVEENLRIFAGLYEVGNVKKRIEEILETFEAGDLRKKKISQLSAGQRTKIMLCKAFLNKPKLVYLDEPTASLDPDIAEKMRSYLLNLQRCENTSVLFTSHNMSEVEEVCNRVIFLNHGKIVAEDTPRGLARRNRKTIVKLIIRDGLKRSVHVIKELNFKYKITERSISIETDEREVAILLAELAGKGVEYDDITIDKPDLEEFFISMTRKAV
jgi:ABC-2 type transport system ATP-binding protein